MNFPRVPKTKSWGTCICGKGRVVQSRLALACLWRVPEGSQRNAFRCLGLPVEGPG